ncbi:MAG: DMT family transporter [Pseudomonadota bacterium]
MTVERRAAGEVSGIALAVAAILMFALMDVIAKGLLTRNEPIMVVWARFASQTFWAVVLLMPRLRQVMRTRHMPLQILRSACLFGATIFFFSAIPRMDLATIVAIFEIAPLLITVLAFLILREPVGPRRLLAVGVGLIGALIIIQPGTEVFTPWALLPIGAAACFASYAIATRFLGADESPWTSFLYTALFGTIAATAIVPFFWATPSLSDAVIMSLFGIVGGFGHFLLILALSRTEASSIAPFTYVGLVFATIFAWIFFDELPGPPTFVGAAIIIGAGLYVWYRERRAMARTA